MIVYLIMTEVNDKKLYKIGYTRRKIEDRVREIKTGNAYDIHVVNIFRSRYYTKIEKRLHILYNEKRLNGEWFDLEQKDVNDFISKCELYHSIFLALSNNTLKK